MRFYYDTKAGTKVPAPGDGLDRLFRSSLFRGLASFALRLFRRQDWLMDIEGPGTPALSANYVWLHEHRLKRITGRATFRLGQNDREVIF